MILKKFFHLKIHNFFIPSNIIIKMENGYSIVVFSNFFQKVKGIDLFNGDFHSVLKNDHYSISFS